MLERSRPPIDYEEMIQRIGFYFGMQRDKILWDLTLDEFYSYHKNALFFYLESQGKPVKKPSTEQDREFQKERKEMLKKVYGEV